MSAQTPQRYDCAGPKHPWEHCEGCYHMEPHPRGDYVQWDDYDSLRAINAELLAALDGLAEVADLAPEPHCSCHNAPPCGDCVEWGGLREALKDSRALLTRAKGETT